MSVVNRKITLALLMSKMKHIRQNILRKTGCALLAAVALGAVAADEPLFDTSLNESVIKIPKRGTFSNIELETTVFKPPGDGPFPLAVINHGKAAGNPVFQARARYSYAARELVKRGFAVVIPMREGFSKSGGSYISGGCNVASNGLLQAEDVVATLDYMTAQSYIDPKHIVVMGQSHGGFTTMAFGTLVYSGVRALVNFAGGLRQDQCPGWEGTLARAFGKFGAAAQYPSLWFYGDNDSYWSPWLYQQMHKSYTTAGGKARLIAFGIYSNGDAHGMFSQRQGLPIWLPEVERFLTEQGFDMNVKFDIPSRRPKATIPPPSLWAAANEVDKVPYLREPGRQAYREFLNRAKPRAFALSAAGNFGWSADNDLAVDSALEICQRKSTTPCQLYLVDDDVVWQESAGGAAQDSVGAK